MSKAHKIGVKELKQALMQATEMYKGTAADLSSTTEGARASMESAQARMYKASADSYNAVMRDFYTR